MNLLQVYFLFYYIILYYQQGCQLLHIGCRNYIDLHLLHTVYCLAGNYTFFKFFFLTGYILALSCFWFIFQYVCISHYKFYYNENCLLCRVYCVKYFEYKYSIDILIIFYCKMLNKNVYFIWDDCKLE